MKIEIDTKDIAEAITDNINDYKMLDCISDDILKDNPDWWTERVVEPIKNDILKLMQTKEFRKDMVNYLLEETEIEKKIIKEATDKIVKDIEIGLTKIEEIYPSFWGKWIEACRGKVEKNNQAEKDKAFKEYVAKCGKDEYVSYPKFEREYNLRKWLK